MRTAAQMRVGTPTCRASPALATWVAAAAAAILCSATLADARELCVGNCGAQVAENVKFDEPLPSVYGFAGLYLITFLIGYAFDHGYAVAAVATFTYGLYLVVSHAIFEAATDSPALSADYKALNWDPALSNLGAVGHVYFLAGLAVAGLGGAFAGDIASWRLRKPAPAAAGGAVPPAEQKWTYYYHLKLRDYLPWAKEGEPRQHKSDDDSERDPSASAWWAGDRITWGTLFDFFLLVMMVEFAAYPALDFWSNPDFAWFGLLALFLVSMVVLFTFPFYSYGDTIISHAPIASVSKNKKGEEDAKEAAEKRVVAVVTRARSRVMFWGNALVFYLWPYMLGLCVFYSWVMARSEAYSHRIIFAVDKDEAREFAEENLVLEIVVVGIMAAAQILIALILYCATRQS